MKNSPPTLSAPERLSVPEYFTDEKGIRWSNVKPRECQCVDCKFERVTNIFLRTPKQCEA